MKKTLAAIVLSAFAAVSCAKTNQKVEAPEPQPIVEPDPEVLAYQEMCTPYEFEGNILGSHFQMECLPYVGANVLIITTPCPPGSAAEEEKQTFIDSEGRDMVVDEFIYSSCNDRTIYVGGEKSMLSGEDEMKFMFFAQLAYQTALHEILAAKYDR